MEHSAVVPAYNEQATIEAAVRETAAVFASLAAPYEIIVVDDGSADATAAVVERLAAELPSVRLVRHSENRGKGEAVRTGVMEAKGKDILFLDADLATSPSEAIAFIEALKTHELAIGSRRVAGAKIEISQPWGRSFSGRVINFMIRHALKLPYRDTQCGFKMFRAEAAKEIFRDMRPSRWIFDAEALSRAHELGFAVAEIPVVWRHGRVSRVRVREVLADLLRLVGAKNAK